MWICCRKIVKLLQCKMFFSDWHIHPCNGSGSGGIFPFNVPRLNKKKKYGGD